MKKIIFSILLSALLQFGFAQTIPTDQLYLGQTAPGTTPVKFDIPYRSGNMASEIVAVSSEGKDIYYGERTKGDTPHFWIKHFAYVNGAWCDSMVLFDGYTHPSLSPSGDTMFFHKYITGSPSWTAVDYFSVRKNNKWSTPAKSHLGLVRMTNSGDYYVETSKGISKIVINGLDTTFVSVGLDSLKSMIQNYSISRDGSFIIFQSPNGEYGHYDLFIIFRKSDGTWGRPNNLGSPINTRDYDVEPYITDDNKFLFFMRANPTQLIYWVRVDNLIDKLKIENGITSVKN